MIFGDLGVFPNCGGIVIFDLDDGRLRPPTDEEVEWSRGDGDEASRAA